MSSSTRQSTSSPSTENLIRLGGVPSVPDYLRSIWERREFALNMAAGELRSQNFDTVLGNLWHVLNPMMLVAVYFLMFGLILGVDRGMPNFIGFLAVGIFTYSFLQKSTTSGASSIVNNLGLIRSLQFPRALLPISSVFKETLAYGTTLLVMVLVILVTEVQACAGDEVPAACATFTIPVTPGWLMFVPIFGLMLFFGMGAAFITARMTDHVRDTTNFLPYLFRIAFYVSGVLYPVDRFVREPWMKDVFNANPFYVYVTLARHYLMPTYTASDLTEIWIAALLWPPALFLFGLFYFRARENRYGRG
ncbi:MAG: ABC transporter permease [Nitriliruptorales bacterium]|nr:ABC transporter permease [Nitriliruptorales bacterium]